MGGTPAGADARLVVGVDIGGTGIKGAPVDLTAGTFASPRTRRLTPVPATPERVLETVQEVVAQHDTP